MQQQEGHDIISDGSYEEDDIGKMALFTI